MEEHKLGKCILVCAGELNLEGLSLEVNPGDFCIVADGGVNYLDSLSFAFGLKPDLVVGDFDSVDTKSSLWIQELKKDCPEMVVSLPREKDDTDTMAAVKLALEKGYRDFVILGAMGARADHYFANIQTLLFIKRYCNEQMKGVKCHSDEQIIGDKSLCNEQMKGVNSKQKGSISIKLLDGKGETFVLENESIELFEEEGTIFSMFSLSDECTVTIEGLKYEVENYKLTNSNPIGVSNEFLGCPARITVSGGAVVCFCLKCCI